MDKNAIMVHRLYRALVYAESKLKTEGLWGEVEDQTIGQPLTEYRQSGKQSAKGFKEALIADTDTDVGC